MKKKKDGFSGFIKVPPLNTNLFENLVTEDGFYKPDDALIEYACVGIDQSYSGTGIVMIYKNLNDPIKRVMLTEVKAKKALKSEEVDFFYRVEPIITTLYKCLPDKTKTHVVMEGAAYGAAFNVFKLGELSGGIKLVLGNMGYNLYSVAPTSVKSFITGHGLAPKDVVKESVNSILNTEIKNDNVTDAAAIALISLSLVLGRSS